MKKVSILGSTGTIGRLTLDVIRSMKDSFQISALAANCNTDLLKEQIEEFAPRKAVVLDTNSCNTLSSNDISDISCGHDALTLLGEEAETDILVVAMTGTSTVQAVLKALETGKRVALATKEILVSFGNIVIQALKQGGGELLPIDSEHNALHQCLDGRKLGDVKKLILTASGGPFRNKSFKDASVDDVLAHPTWNMGARITVDSATLMNKGFEVIEAHYLFGIEPDLIDVIVHPQSIIHSMVEFNDSSILAQMALPDMRLPIAYALSYPKRTLNLVNSLNLVEVGALTFEKPDTERFPCLKLAYEALKHGGTSPAILQAADYEAVNQFLAGKISFKRIPQLIEGALDSLEKIDAPSINEIRKAEGLARDYVIKECNAIRT